MFVAETLEHFVVSDEVAGFIGLEFAGGAGGMDEDEFGASDGEKRGENAVPDIFADEDADFSEACFDDAEFGAFFMESVFIEDAISGEEEFLIVVEEGGFPVFDCEIGGGVKWPSCGFFVIANGDVELFWEILKSFFEFCGDLLGREGECIDSAFEDITSWCGFGKYHKVGTFLCGLRDGFRQMVERSLEIAFDWLGLETSNLEWSRAILH